MMDIPTTYALLATLVLLMNVVPAFMPPTWTVLAFFYAFFHLALIPTVIIGAVCATTGRIVLALLSRYYFGSYIPKKYLKNYVHLGKYFKTYQKFTLPIMFTYAFFPVSSNDVYIIAGLSRISLRVIATSFFVGRLFSYSLWVSTANHFSKQLSALFTNHITSIPTITFELLGIACIILIGKIDWSKILKLERTRG